MQMVSLCGMLCLYTLDSPRLLLKNAKYFYQNTYRIQSDYKNPINLFKILKSRKLFPSVFMLKLILPCCFIKCVAKSKIEENYLVSRTLLLSKQNFSQSFSEDKYRVSVDIIRTKIYLF